MDYAADIPQSLALSAFSGTSFSPEKRAASTRTEYAETLAQDYAEFTKQAEKGGTLDILEAEFSKYRAKYASRYRAYLASSSRCVSSFIVGPSGFPAARMNKRADIAHKRLSELLDFGKRARSAVIRNLRPDLAPIMSGDSDALQRLRAELEKLQVAQSQMKEVNAAHKAFMKNSASLEKSDLPENVKQRIRDYKPAYSWEPHPFAPFQLTNNSANIRRIEKRIEALSVTKSAPVTAIEGSAARLEDDPPVNRVRLFFPSKPDEAVRAKLKSSGFRWSPTIGAWQAYRHPHTIELAQQIAA